MGFGYNPVQESDQTITNDGFFPDINVADFQNVFHDVNDVDSEKVIHSLKVAMVDVNRQLKSIKASSEFPTLIESDSESIGGASVLELHYKTAVFGVARSNLLPLLITVSKREKAEELETNFDVIQQQLMIRSNQAIRELHGMTSATVELI